jgi:putative ABC transport system permease protein
MEGKKRIAKPPRLAERILRACLPRGIKGLAILGDLREDYYARVRGREGPGSMRNSIWFWREALLLSLRYMNITNDVRLALRSLHRNAATSAVIILTLGSAMAASTIGFTVADLALLRGLPVDDGQRVVMVYGIDIRTGTGRSRLSPANFRDLKERVTTLAQFAAFENASATIVDRGIPASLDATRVGADFFTAMGQKPFLGRLYQRGDDEPGRSDLVVLAHQYWSRVLGADPSIVGRSLLVDGRQRMVIGVASPELEFGDLANVEVWLPLEIPANASRTERTYTTMARLAEGVTLAQARAEIESIAKALTLEFPAENREWRATVVAVGDAAYGSGFWVIVALFVAAVTLVMVIASANAASLILARAMARRREIALRSALGAGRWRLLRQALVEGVVLSLGSMALAVPLAELGLRAIRSVDSDPVFKQLRLDSHELGFLGIIAFIAPIVFSMLPTLAAVRLDLRMALQSGGLRSGMAASRGRTVLVAVQLVLAVTLLTVAGLTIRTAINLANIDPGIHSTGALTFGVDLANPLSPVAEPRALIDDAQRRLQALPSVISVHAFESMPVIVNERLVSMEIEGHQPREGDAAPGALINASTAGALEALRVRLVAGRWLTDQDEQGNERVVVGAVLAQNYFGSPSAALGKTLTTADRRMEIVGVVSDVLMADLERGPVPRVWTGLREPKRATFVIMAHGNPADLSEVVRREMVAIAPMIPLEHLDTLEGDFKRVRSRNQLVIGMLAGFAGLALLLAATGLYGLISYTVAQRIGEFGTRFALGARPRDVLLLVVRQVARLMAIGLSVGLLAGLAAGQAMRSVLYGVSTTDPVTIVSVIGVMATAALVASIRPAIRAARVNPIDALRAE